MSQLHYELQSLAQSAMVTLYELDLTSKGGTLYRFCGDVNPLSGDVIWQGHTYTRLPVTASGFAKNSSGSLPRPTLQVSNLQGAMAQLARQYDYFLGCKLTRKRTFARFLDSANFSTANPNADPTQHMQDDVWYVDRKSIENSTIMEFELASILDMQGVRLPRRQMIQNLCTAQYRSSECSYTGGPVAKDDDTATSDPTQDKCSKRISGCKLRFSDVLPYNSFPGVGLVK